MKNGAGVREPDDTGTLHVSYDAAKQARISLTIIFVLLVLVLPFISSDIFILHLFGVAGFALSILFLFECLATRRIRFEPARIVKTRLFLGDTVIPAPWAVASANQQTITFYHGSTDNFRERIVILRSLVSEETSEEIMTYAKKTYQIPSKRNGRDGSGIVSPSGTRKTIKEKINPLILDHFDQAVNSYKVLIVLFILYAVIVVFAVIFSDSFDGLAPSIPPFQLGLAGAALAVGTYFILRSLDPEGGKNSEKGPSAAHRNASVASLFKKESNKSFVRALLANMVALLGLAVFLLSGNLLDFYLFFCVGVFYYVEFYPRLSTWMRIAGENYGYAAKQPEAAVLMPVSAKRRSLQVSLVLMGALAVTSYGESRNYLYKNKKDCMDDWGSEQSCREAPASSGYYRTGYYFGPRYGTPRGGVGTHSVGAITISRGGFGSLGGFHASFGG